MASLRPMKSEWLAALAQRIGAALSDQLIEAISAEMMDRGWADPLAAGEVYERQVAQSRAGRQAAGIYYTPSYLVDFVVERTLGASIDAGHSPRVLDPACGGGAFLLGALARGVAGDRLVGIDVDPIAAAVCKLALAIAGVAEPDVRVADTLLDEVEIGPVDAIVGNPPWGQKRLRFAADVGARLRKRYLTAQGVLDPFKLFLERGLELLGDGGRLGMVLPDIILLKNQQPVRDLLLQQSSIEWLVHAGRAFSDVNLDAAVAVLRKQRPDSDHVVRIWRELPKTWRTLAPAEYQTAQSVFTELPGHRFNLYLDAASLGLLRRLAPLPRLGQYFEAHEGVHTGNARAKLFLARPRGDHCVPLVLGKGELARYRLSWAGGWLDRDPKALDGDAGDYANLGRAEWHTSRKLVVRRTGDRVVSARDVDGYHVSNNLFVVLPRGAMSDEQLRGYLGLLNSRFMTWYFRTVNPRVGRLFAELKLNHLVDFPVPLGGVAGFSAWVSKLEQIANDQDGGARAGEERARLQSRLDEAVEKAFGLTELECSLVRATAATGA